MLKDIVNFVQLTDRIATGGQPSAAQIEEIAAKGYQTIINLLPFETDHSLPNERSIVETQGMRYFHIPVVWKSPDRSDLLEFCNAMDEQGDRKVFVHCAVNMRVSAFMALYRVLRLGWTWEQAYPDVEPIWTPVGWWREFIDARLAEGKI